MSRLRRRTHRVVLACLLATMLALGLGAVAPTATARAGVPAKVFGLTSAGQNWAAGTLTIRWRAVQGSTYQVRWARTTGSLATARIHRSSTARATSPVLRNRCVTWYAQVRAVRSGRVGAWSSARGVRFANHTPGVPALTYSTDVQTSETAVRVQWTRTPYVARYRLDWSAAPAGYWRGFEHNHTPWQGATSTGTTLALPTAVPGTHDRFLPPAYGNPVYAQLNYDNGCSTTVRKSSYFGVFPRPRDPGPGDTLAVGTYNLELPDRLGPVPAKVDNLAENIAGQDVDVVALQETNAERAEALIARLAAHGQPDWESYGVGAQRVIWRTSQWDLADVADVGRASDGNPATPLPTPAVRLTPAAGVAADGRQDVLVVSVHLEDTPDATIAQRKRNARDASAVLLSEIDDANPDDVPVIVGGDLKGMFSDGTVGSGYCDENNGCVGEGQPTFVRAGFWDSRTAVVKGGLAYGTVNKHDPTPPRNSTGVGGRTDFLLARGTGGFSLHRNVVRTFGDASENQQSDHNLVVARVVVPRVP